MADDADVTAALRALAPARRAQFDAGAEAYDAYRPGCPGETFDDLMSITGLRSGDHVIEGRVGHRQGHRAAGPPYVVDHLHRAGEALTAMARRKLSG